MTNCVYTIPAPRDGGPIPFFEQAGRRSLPHGWLCSSQKRGTSSQILAQRYTQTNTLHPVKWMSQTINKPQCNHTHNTHWVHLKCTQIKHGNTNLTGDAPFTNPHKTQQQHQAQTTQHPITNKLPPPTHKQ